MLSQPERLASASRERAEMRVPFPQRALNPVYPDHIQLHLLGKGEGFPWKTTIMSIGDMEWDRGAVVYSVGILGGFPHCLAGRKIHLRSSRCK
jgi:hypothetical protein